MQVTQIKIEAARGRATLYRWAGDRIGVHVQIYGQDSYEGKTTSVKVADVASQSMLARRIRKAIEALPIPLDEGEDYMHLFELLSEGN